MKATSFEVDKSNKICKTTLADLYWSSRKFKCSYPPTDLPSAQPTTYCAFIMCKADYFVKMGYGLETEDLIVVEDSNTCKANAATAAAAAAAAKSGSVLTASLTAVSVAIYATMF